MIYYFVNNLQSYSGAALQARNLSEYIEKDILLVNNSTFPDTQKSSDNIYNLSRNYVVRFFQIISLFKSPSLEIVHFHGHFLIPMIFCWIFQIPFIVKTTLLNSDDFLTLKKSKYGWLRLFVSKKCTINIVLTKSLMRRNQKFIESTKIRLIPNGVKVPKDCILLSEKENYFYCCGVVSKRKKTLEAIKFFHHKYSMLKNAKLYVVGPIDEFGNNHEFDKAYVNECFDYVKINKLNDNVIFTGLISQQETLNLAMKAKALIHFSESEGMPNVALEAMAMNCVPILADLDGTAEEIIGIHTFEYLIDNKFNIKEIDGIINSQILHRRAVENFDFRSIKMFYDEIYEAISMERRND